MNGDVEGTTLQSNLEMYSVNGSVQFSTTGWAEAETVNGSITASLGKANWDQAANNLRKEMHLGYLSAASVDAYRPD